MTIRNATPADAPGLADLITQLGYPTTPDQMAARFNVVSSHADYQMLLAEDHLGPVGLVGLHCGLSWEFDGCYVRVGALVVSSRARHQGVGEALIAAAEQWGREMGASRLILNCGNRPERAIAHQFYPAMGFSITTTGYSKKL